MADGAGSAFERFEAAVEAAVEAALANDGLSGVVTIWLQDAGRVRPTVELVEIAASPMRQGHGTKAMGAILRVADETGVRMSLRVANGSDDFRTWDEEDLERPPSEDELVAWYGRFGFEVISSFDETVMVREPQPVPTLGPSL